MSDSVPLVEVERVALLDFYGQLKCNDPLVCPNSTTLRAGAPCPTLPPSAFSERLLCRAGSVVEIGIYGGTQAEFRSIRTRQGGPGALSSQLSKLSELGKLYLFGGFDATGTIPSNVWSLRKLRRLNLSQLSLTGSLPTDAPPGLQELAIQDTLIEGTLPPALLALSTLTDVRLSHNKLVGHIGSFEAMVAARTLGGFVRCTLSESAGETNCVTCEDATCCQGSPCTLSTTTTTTMAKTTTMATPTTPTATSAMIATVLTAMATKTTMTAATKTTLQTMAITPTIATTPTTSIKMTNSSSSANVTTTVTSLTSTSDLLFVPPTSNVPVGAVVGGAVGAVVLCALLVAVVAWVTRRRRRREAAPRHDTAIYGQLERATSTTTTAMASHQYDVVPAPQPQKEQQYDRGRLEA